MTLSRTYFHLAALFILAVIVGLAYWFGRHVPGTAIPDLKLAVQFSTPQERYDYLLREIAKVDAAIRPAVGTARQDVEKRFVAPAGIPRTDIYNGELVKNVADYQLMPGTSLHVQYQDGHTVKSWITYEFIDFGSQRVYFANGGGVLGFLVDFKEPYWEGNVKSAEYDYMVAEKLRTKLGLSD